MATYLKDADAKIIINYRKFRCPFQDIRRQHKKHTLCPVQGHIQRKASHRTEERKSKEIPQKPTVNFNIPSPCFGSIKRKVKETASAFGTTFSKSFTPLLPLLLFFKSQGGNHLQILLETNYFCVLFIVKYPVKTIIIL